MPVSRLGWAFSLLDRQAHTVNPDDVHPLGVWIALCGHRMLGGELQRQPFGGPCPHCAGLITTRRAPSAGVIRWIRTPDERCHAVVGPTNQVGTEQPGRFVAAMCGKHLPRGGLTVQPHPSGIVCSRCVAGDPVHPPAPSMLGTQSPRPTSSSGTSLVRRIETGQALTHDERLELGKLIRLATTATRLVNHRPGDADHATWLAGAWAPVGEQLARLLNAHNHD